MSYVYGLPAHGTDVVSLMSIPSTATPAMMQLGITPMAPAVPAATLLTPLQARDLARDLERFADDPDGWTPRPEH
jgi:hypothetical protein